MVVAPVFTVIRTSSVVNNMTNLDSRFTPDTLDNRYFELCVTILSKNHQKYPKNHDFRGVVVAPVFIIIGMSFVIDNITTLDSGFVCRHPHGSILVFFELCVTILSTTFHTPRIFECSISKNTKPISKILDVLESWRCLLYMLKFSGIKFKYWRSYIRLQKNPDFFAELVYNRQGSFNKSVKPGIFETQCFSFRSIVFFKSWV